MKLIKIFIISLLFLPVLTFASECSRDGYTVITINGMITTPEGAVYNRDAIRKVINKNNFNGEKLTVDYIYNESHVLGLVDFIDSANQKVMENFVYPTYDLDKMLGDLSDKVNTQKLLLVAHSQGNFYANDIYNSIASKEGGVPKESMAIYGIGTPTSYIAGGGKYILSSNDEIMNWVRLWGFLDVLPANVTIEGGEEGDDKRGHNLSTIYLKYQGKRIAKEIEESLMTLRENDIQNEDKSCIAKKDTPFFHKIVEVFYKVVDPISIFIRDQVKETVEEGLSIYNYENMENILTKLPASVGDFSAENKKEKTAGKVTGEQKAEDKKEEIKQNEIIKTKIEQQTNELVLQTELEEKEEIKEEKSSSSRHHSSHTNDEEEDDNEEENNDDEENNEQDNEEEVNDDDEENHNEEEEENDDDNEENNEEDDEEITDTTPPVIVLNGENYLLLEENSVYTEEGATATDETDGSVLVTIEGVIDTTILGEQTITYKAIDGSGNVSILNRTVTVFKPSLNLIIDKDIELANGEYSYDQVIVRNNSTLKLLGQPEGDLDYRGVKIIANKITVEEGSKISADSQGYILGPGSLESGYASNNGMSYGGKGGGKESLSLYGSATKPTDLGSGVSSYQRGGGAIWLEARDSLINDGVISANGSTHASGGSIYIRTNKLEGVGEFNANGGGAIWQYPSSAGGGGRIAIYYRQLDFSGNVLAEGGGICNSGCYKVGEDGTVGLFDLENNSLKIVSSWRFEKNESPYIFKDITLSNNSKVESEEGVVIEAENLSLSEESLFSVGEDKDFTFSNINIDGSYLDMKEGGKIKARNILIDNDSRITLGGDENLDIKKISILNGSTLTTEPEKIVLLDLEYLTIDESSYINADAKGYFAGPGTPTEGTRAGLYGGDDFYYRDLVYGSSVWPTDFGSAGASLGRRGGGAIHIIVDNFINNGVVSARGGPNASGGSILVEAFNFEGNGSFNANGGSSYTTAILYAPGGGGRIALHYEFSSFQGKLEVKGGCVNYDGTNPTCSPDGTAGEFDEHYGVLRIVSSWEFRLIDNDIVYNKIDACLRAKIKAEDGVNIKANILTLQGEVTLTLSGGVLDSKEINVYDFSVINTQPERAINIISTNVSINSTSKITADDKGYLVGPGTPENMGSNGASYGGYGGGESSKPPYGSSKEPLDFGSGNGSSRGGGAIHMIVENSLTNDGVISARGTKVRTSGGSIYIETGSLSGSGSINANGCQGYESNPSIGGSGGRIAISHGRDFYFTGEITSSAGSYYSRLYRPEEQDGTIEIIPRFIKVSDYSLNWEKENVITNPSPDEDVSIFIKTNQDVDWVSVQVKNKEDSQIYKTFQDGSGCLDGTNNCLKFWDGTLSKSDKTLVSGNYQIIVKIKDLKTGEEVTEILPSEIIVIIPKVMASQVFSLDGFLSEEKTILEKEIITLEEEVSEIEEIKTEEEFFEENDLDEILEDVEREIITEEKGETIEESEELEAGLKTLEGEEKIETEIQDTVVGGGEEEKIEPQKEQEVVHTAEELNLEPLSPGVLEDDLLDKQEKEEA